MSRWSFADWFFSRQCRRRGKSRHVQHAPPAARRYRKPQIQQLELRTLLTTFLVDRSDDVSATAAQVCTAAPNDCTLRGAIIAANQNQGADTITFDPTLAGVPITLSLPNAGGDENLAKAGDLDVLDDLTIQGQSAANTIIQGGTNASNGIDKVFSINPNRDHAVNFTLFGVTVQFGRNTQPVTPAPNFSYTGAGLDWCGFAGGNLFIRDSVFANKRNVFGYGGGINIDGASATGTVTITNTAVINNTSTGT